MQIQYLGFEPKERGRDYTYLVTDMKSGDRKFTFSIPLQALLERRVRYQDAAYICFQKLQKALEDETAERPLPRHVTVSDQELQEYKEKHNPAKRRAG